MCVYDSFFIRHVIGSIYDYKCDICFYFMVPVIYVFSLLLDVHDWFNL
jgi:hypothetical protein